MAAVQQNINCRREMLSGDIVEVHSRLRQIGDKSIRFVHEMRNGETGDVAATSELTAVHLDRRLRKSCLFTPEIIRSAGEKLLFYERRDRGTVGVIDRLLL